MIRRFIISVLLLSSLLAVVGARPAAAIHLPNQLRQVAVCGGSFVDFLGLEPWYACVYDTDKKQVKVDRLNDVWLIALTILEDTIKLGTYIATGFIVWGGIKYIKSQGDPGQLSQSKDVIRNAIMGMLWTLLAVAIVQFIAGGIK